MLSMRTILVPVDFSGPSKRAIGYALSLALELDATLVLAHIVPVSSGTLYTFPIEGNTVPEEMVEEARAKLLDLIDPEYRGGIRHREVALAGDLQETLIELAHTESADLVVMGTHGRRPFERWLLGSVTERMLRKITVPIMTVSHLDDAHTIDRPHPVKMERILYATDLSPVAERAVDVAAALAHQFSAELHIVHVRPSLPGYEGTYIAPDDERKISGIVEKRVVDSVPESIRRMPNVRIETIDGRTYEALLAYADEHAMDMIVLSTQSRTGIERALLGSVAERVVRGARVPVLSVPPVDAARPLPLLAGGRFMI